VEILSPRVVVDHQKKSLVVKLELVTTPDLLADLSLWMYRSVDSFQFYALAKVAIHNLGISW